MGGSSPQGSNRDASRRERGTMAHSNINEAIKIMETFVRGENWPERAKEAWKAVKEAALSSGQRGDASQENASKDIKEIKEQVAGIMGMIKELKPGPVQAKQSYADALKANWATGAKGRDMPVPARRSREVVVAAGTEDIKQKQRSGAEIVRDINGRLTEEAVVAARRLPSGDVLVTFEGPEAKEKWGKSPGVLGAFGTEARTRTSEYTIIAHGIRVSAVDIANQETAIAGIYAQNPKLKGTIDIVRVGWDRKTLKQGKRTAPLHIGIAEPKQANQLLDQGLLFNSELHDCEIFNGDCRVVQCFKCYSYGHVAKHCTSVIKCGFCAAAGHKSADCPKQGEVKAHKCTNCKGNPNHTAWARECPVRRARVAAARQAYLDRPTRFQTHEYRDRNTDKTQTTGVFPIQTMFTPASSIPSFTGSQQQGGSESEQEAPAPKRRRGRPTVIEILQRPTPGAQDIREALFSSQNE